MASERCPKCGAPMCEEWSRELDENLEPIAYQVCSADRRDCRIAELERQLEAEKSENAFLKESVGRHIEWSKSKESERDALKAEIEEAKANELSGNSGELEALLRASEARERELQGKLDEAKEATRVARETNTLLREEGGLQIEHAALEKVALAYKRERDAALAQVGVLAKSLEVIRANSASQLQALNAINAPDDDPERINTRWYYTESGAALSKVKL